MWITILRAGHAKVLSLIILNIEGKKLVFSVNTKLLSTNRYFERGDFRRTRNDIISPVFITGRCGRDECRIVFRRNSGWHQV